MSGNFDDGVAWGQLLRVHATMMQKLEAMLQTRYQISHGEFEVLLRLSWAPDQRMRIRDLADASVLTRSGMSRLVDRLEQAGLVRRETAAEDARGAYAILTPTGRARLEAAESSNIALVREVFLSLYTPDELAQMAAFWERFMEHHAAPGDP
jgi:DNA-binding MarR family transcriptional regulator